MADWDYDFFKSYDTVSVSDSLSINHLIINLQSAKSYNPFNMSNNEDKQVKAKANEDLEKKKMERDGSNSRQSQTKKSNSRSGSTVTNSTFTEEEKKKAEMVKQRNVKTNEIQNIMNENESLRYKNKVNETQIENLKTQISNERKMLTEERKMFSEERKVFSEERKVFSEERKMFSEERKNYERIHTFATEEIDKISLQNQELNEKLNEAKMLISMFRELDKKNYKKARELLKEEKSSLRGEDTSNAKALLKGDEIENETK